jgi:hypothetical protein
VGKKILLYFSSWDFFFQEEKKQIAVTKAADKALLDKSSLDIELVPETSDDKKMAGLMKYSVTRCKFLCVLFLILL